MPKVDPLADPTRIAVAGDWHENGPWARKAIAHAAEQGADVIVHVGDYGYEYSAKFMKAVETALAAAGIALLFVDGNHENHPTLNRYAIGTNGLRQLTPHVWHMPRGFRWTWAGVRFLALGGAHSVDRPWREPGISWWKEEWITEAQAQHAIDGGPADVLVSHDCPAGVHIPDLDRTAHLFPPLEIMRADEHRRILRRVTDAVQPSTIWHGHYHRAYETIADLGYGPVQVTGLDCDETSLACNVRVVDMTDLAA